MTPYVPEPELTWHDIQKAIETASLPAVPAPAAEARVPLGPGSRVKVRADVKNEGPYDAVEDYATRTGTIKHSALGCGDNFEDEYDWCVRLDGYLHTTQFHTHELEEAA